MPHKNNKGGQFVSASEQDTIELCKDNYRPATVYNVDSNCKLKKGLRVNMFEEATIIDNKRRRAQLYFCNGHSNY